MQHLENVKKYYALWTDVALGDFDTATYKAIPSEKRDQRQEGYSRNFAVYCLVRGQSIILSYSPALADYVRTIKDARPDNIAAILQEQFQDKLERRKVFYFDAISVPVDTSDVVTLKAENYIDYERFFMEQNPGLTTEDWLNDYFGYLCKNGLCFGLYADGKLASATDAPFTPYMPEVIAEPGINTLPQYRKKGYAKAVCAAFLKHQIAAGKTTIWTCGQGNIASQNLARSLGFQEFADLYSVHGDVGG